jgi:hypothetical protein
MPAVVIVMTHAAFTVDVNDPHGFLPDRKHGGYIGMTAFAVGVAVAGSIVRYGRIGKIVVIIIQVDIINTGHIIDVIERALERCPVVFQHGFVQGTFYQ